MAPPPVYPPQHEGTNNHNGSNGNTSGAKEDEGLVTILVTGFGPFQEKFPVNPSYEIARSLPDLLPSSTKADGGTTTVRVIGYGSPIRVCYADTRALIPALLASYSQTVDLVLHIGMASGRKYYTAERYGNRDGYIRNKDLDGRLPPTDEAEEFFGDCPSKMTTSLDFEDVVRRWQEAVSHMAEASAAHKADCRPSEDAGHFLCDYTYFSSMAWYAKRNRSFEGGEVTDRPVLFLHVPAESDDLTLDRGRAVAVALMRAMVDSYVGAKV